MCRAERRAFAMGRGLALRASGPGRGQRPPRPPLLPGEQPLPRLLQLLCGPSTSISEPIDGQRGRQGAGSQGSPEPQGASRPLEASAPRLLKGKPSSVNVALGGKGSEGRMARPLSDPDTTL